jgi:hypothetical protein
VGEQTQVHVDLYTDIMRRRVFVNESRVISLYATFNSS